jgi:hypothetical protein
MRIPIVPISGKIGEYSLIELQGSIITRSVSFENETIGPLTFEGDNATLRIGNHLLIGKRVNVEPPLAVLKRGPIDQVDLVAVIRSKVIFFDRPNMIFDSI